jgi:hypothetical protein
MEDLYKLKESLAFSAFRGLLRNALTLKDRVEARDIQQFAYLKDSLQISQEASDKIYIEAAKTAVVDHAKAFLVPKEGTGAISADMAQRFREQVTI